MGHDVHTIGKHSLNTSSIESLAKDISERLQANVEYGVYDNFYFDWDGFPREPSYEKWIFGKVCYANAKESFWLSDKFFSYHIIFARYGDDIFTLPYFMGKDHYEWLETEVRNSTCYDLYNETIQDDYGVIYNNTFHDWYNYFKYFEGRWGTFHYSFLDFDYMEEVIKLRKKTKMLYNKLGGNEVYFFNDQGETQYLTENYYAWEQIKNEVKRRFPNTILNISEFMKKPKTMPASTYFDGFYDDFKDLINE